MDINQNISGILAETQKLKDANVELEASLQRLAQAQEKIASSAGKFSRAYQDNALELRKADAALKSNTEQIDKNIKMFDMAKGALEKNKALLDSLKAQYTALTSSQGDNAAGASKLNNQIALLGKTVEDQEKKLTKSREVFDFHEKSVEALGSAFDDLKTGAGDFAPVLQSAAEGFNTLESGLEIAETGFKSVGSAIKTTGFGLLLLVLQSLTEYFTTDKTGIKQFKAILAGLGVVIDKIKSAFSQLRHAVVDAILNPGETVKNLWNGILENLGNRFKALGVILDGVLHFNPKKITDGVLQLGTGVTNATDKIKTAIKAVGEEGTKTLAQIKKAVTDEFNKPDKKKQAKAIRPEAPKRKKKPLPKPEIMRATQVLTASSYTLDKQIQDEKKAYDDELALLNDQLSKKLISQADFNTKSMQLQQQYHQNLGSQAKDFAEKSMPNAMKQLKNVTEANRLESAVDKDEKDVKKAILPWKKFDAEKKLIQDKYAYEITQAQGNEEKIKEIKEKGQQAENELTAKYQQQRTEFALNSAQQVADKAFSIIGNNIKSASDAKIKGFEKDKANELSNKNLTETQRKAIEDKYQKKEAQEKLKAFKAEQKMSVLQAVVNGALAVTKATAQTGILAPFVIPAIIASTALQVATIVAQKPPAFAKGGQFVSDGRGALLPGYSRTDNTNAYLRSGEAVVVSEAMRNPWARNLVSAINVAHGGRDFSMPNTSRGYAIGGIFTDGGNANRYYNQPVNDMKDMANTLAYQMLNNFPPIYVDVKDVNNQQNILAQTVNRVNL